VFVVRSAIESGDPITCVAKNIALIDGAFCKSIPGQIQNRAFHQTAEIAEHAKSGLLQVRKWESTTDA
jgi:hypothetical protein